jgi:hypothetical protein
MAGIDKQTRVLELVTRLTLQLDEGTRVNVLIQEREQREARSLIDLRQLTIQERLTLPAVGRG